VQARGNLTTQYVGLTIKNASGYTSHLANLEKGYIPHPAHMAPHIVR